MLRDVRGVSGVPLIGSREHDASDAKEFSRTIVRLIIVVFPVWYRERTGNIIQYIERTGNIIQYIERTGNI